MSIISPPLLFFTLLLLFQFVSSLPHPSSLASHYYSFSSSSNDPHLEFALQFFDLVRAPSPNISAIRPLESEYLASVFPTSEAWSNLFTPYRTFVRISSTPLSIPYQGEWLVMFDSLWTYTIDSTPEQPKVTTNFTIKFVIMVNISDPKQDIVHFLQTDFDWTPPPYAGVPGAGTFAEEDFNDIGPCHVGGTLTYPVYPVGETPRAALIFMGGSGGGDRDGTMFGNKVFKDLAWGLAQMGNYAILRYEKRDFKSRPLCPLTNVTYLKIYTYEQEYFEDASSAIELLTSKFPGVPIVVLGHSLGGKLVGGVAQKVGEKIVRGVVHFAGGSELYIKALLRQDPYLWLEHSKTLTTLQQQCIDDMTAVEARLEKAPLPEDFPMPGCLKGLNAAYLNYDMAYDRFGIANSLKIPSLFLNGERDYQVTVKDSYDLWKKNVKNPRAEWEVFHGLTHEFYQSWVDRPSYPEEYYTPGHVRIDVMRRLVEFLEIVLPFDEEES